MRGFKVGLALGLAGGGAVVLAAVAMAMRAFGDQEWVHRDLKRTCG